MGQQGRTGLDLVVLKIPGTWEGHTLDFVQVGFMLPPFVLFPQFC